MPKTKTTTTTSKFKCPKCEFVGGSPASLRVHNARKHSGRNWATIPKGSRMVRNGSKITAVPPASEPAAPAEANTNPYACPQCAFIGRNIMSLKMHTNRMHSVRDKPWRLPGTVKGRDPKSQKAARNGIMGAPAGVVKYCPQCGCHIQKVAIAMEMDLHD